MRTKKYKVWLFILLLFLPALPFSVIAQNQDVSEVKAIQLFNSGNFSEAEEAFQALLSANPENPLLKYYYGASRTENGHYGERELNHLMDAGKNITPERLHYYLGMQHHARNNWDQALRFYNQFRQSVPEAEQKELKLTAKIQQCFNQVNPFSGIVAATSEDNDQNEGITDLLSYKDNDRTVPEKELIQLPASSDADKLSIATELSEQETAVTVPREELPDLPGIKPALPSGEPIKFQVNNYITYLYDSQFQTREGKVLFENGRTMQDHLEINLTEVERLRAEYRNVRDPQIRDTVGEKILALEEEIFSLQHKIKENYSTSRQIENNYWNKAGSVHINNFLLEQDKIKAYLHDVASEKPDALMNDEEDLPGEELVELFEPKPDLRAKKTSEELIYKIQIGAYSKGVPAYRQRLFNKLSVIRTIDSYTDEKGVVVYTTGNLSCVEDALKMQNQVRQEGIQDASVVPFFNGKRITLEQAKKIEAENDI
jgi:tetratricopeptide (TPR) repeat protein